MLKRGLSSARSIRSQAVDTVKIQQPAVVTPPPVVQSPPPPPQVKVKRSIGGFRGGITGFLLGVAVSGSLAYSYLLQDYTNASSLLLASVEELQSQTNQFTKHVKRIDELERSVKSRKSDAGVSSLQSEMHSLLSKLNVEQLDIRSKVTQLETDISKLA